MKKAVVYIRTGLIIIIVNIVLIGLRPAWAVEREWLILFYVSGANDRGLTGYAKDLINQLEKVGSTDKVSAVVAYQSLSGNKDHQLRFQRAMKTLLIRPDHGNPEITSPVVDTSHRTDMASPLNLSLFIRKNIVKYP